MRTYKLVMLNPKSHISHEKDIADAEANLQKMVNEGWTLQQVITPNSLDGAMIGVFYREF